MKNTERGLQYTFYSDLCVDDKKFFNYFRISKPSFEELFSLIEDNITSSDTKMRRSIRPDEKLAVTLRYFGSGATMTDLRYQYRPGISTISTIIQQVCKTIWKRVKPISFPELTKQFWMDTSTQFWEKTNFPHYLGALDGKYIRVIKPEGSGSLYYN
ncbi:hypothetical protein O3P69_009836 [Scylla paramamosain]|uniref:Nuclease HARBI1 n=1 Tax=Scylla paramamosain TaxID=85552 RepID=A0AAW0SNV4_SCYPA